MSPDDRARFIFDEPRPVAEPADAEFPFILLTGRGTSFSSDVYLASRMAMVQPKLSAMFSVTSSDRVYGFPSSVVIVSGGTDGFESRDGSTGGKNSFIQM